MNKKQAKALLENEINYEVTGMGGKNGYFEICKKGKVQGYWLNINNVLAALAKLHGQYNDKDAINLLIAK